VRARVGFTVYDSLPGYRFVTRFVPFVDYPFRLLHFTRCVPPTRLRSFYGLHAVVGLRFTTTVALVGWLPFGLRFWFLFRAFTFWLPVTLYRCCAIYFGCYVVYVAFLLLIYTFVVARTHSFCLRFTVSTTPPATVRYAVTRVLVGYVDYTRWIALRLRCGLRLVTGYGWFHSRCCLRVAHAFYGLLRFTFV